MPSSISAHYEVPPEAYWEIEYFDWSSKYFDRQIQDFYRLLGNDAIKTGTPKALDVGCGIGKALRSLIQANFEVWGIEPSSTFRSRALEFTDLDESRIIGSSIEKADLPESMFDFITLGAVFEHLYHPRECLQKALRWCKPGGIVHIEVPSSNWLIETLYQKLLEMSGSHLAAYLSPMHPPFHLYSFSAKAFALNQEALGFRLLESRIDPCYIYYFPALAKPVISRFMKLTGTGMQLTVYLQKA